MPLPTLLRRALVGAGFFLLATLTLTAAAAAPASRPNVVIFLADDQGWGDLGATGNTMVRTPAIDSLARDGARLDRFYVCSVCAPTRAEMLTGRYHPRGGVRGVSTGQERLNTDERTLADAFKSAGYATGAFGKWHNGSQWPYHPNARGFQEYYGFTSGHWGEYFDAPLEHNGQRVRATGFIADDLTTHAIEFIEKNKGAPFLCYIPYNTPHSPFTVPEKYWQRFKDKPIPQRGPDGDQEDIQITRCVLAMTENLDDNVGRVLRRLDELKLADNTIVIYFSDNGPNSFRYNGGMKGRKGSTEEGGVRSPFFIRWPGKIKPGSTVREIAGAIDLLPTLTKFAGIALPGAKPLDGRDLSPLLLGGGGAVWPERTIFSHQNGNVSARTQTHRLDNRGALYDMIADPGQQRDIAAEQPALAKKLSDSVVAWRKDVLGTPNPAAPGSADATAATNAKGKKKANAAGGGVGLPPDNRPFTVGYAEFPMTPLPARDGVAHGTIRRSANAPNSSYFVNWTSKDDAISWDIEVNTAGTYEVAIDYTCPLADAGSTIELSFNGAKLSGTVSPGWDPPLYTNQDTLPRPAGESKMKPFHLLSLGTIRLEKGRGPLTLRATQIPGKSVMDMRQVTLTLRK
jgi:arylsulfatase A-like enzyme